MQTRFTPRQLADSDTAESERILRKCVHCGFCTATCPTYVLLGDELDSPRGRIYLIKDMLENERPASAEVVRHIDRCLSCLACMTTCPSGVHYQHLIDHARAYVERTYRRPWADRWLRRGLAWMLPHPRRFRLAVRLAAAARPFAWLLPERLRAMLELTPRRLPPAAPPAQAVPPGAAREHAVPPGASREHAQHATARNHAVQHVAPEGHAAQAAAAPESAAEAAGGGERTAAAEAAAVSERAAGAAASDPAAGVATDPAAGVATVPGQAASLAAADAVVASAATSEHAVWRAVGPRKARVGLITGCVQTVLAPHINEATVRVLNRAGADVVAIPGCCGAIVHHLGREDESRRLAGTLIRRLHAELAGEGLDAIVANASGCGTQAKDYGHQFRDDPGMATNAAAVAERVRDVTETLLELGLPEVRRPGGLAVAYHSACSMQHGQRVEQPPRELLRRAGYVLEEVPEGHLCCGSAGTYNLLQPSIAGRLRERKLANIARTGAGVVATGNIGCITQLAAAGGPPVVHTVELLDWATGGPPPRDIPEGGTPAVGGR